MSEVMQVIGALVVLAAAGGVAWSVLLANKNRTDIASLHASNDELRATVTYERGEREREQHGCTEQLQKLNAKIEVLQGEVVLALVTEFSTALKAALQEVLVRSEPTPVTVVAVQDRRDSPPS